MRGKRMGQYITITYTDNEADAVDELLAKLKADLPWAAEGSDHGPTTKGYKFLNYGSVPAGEAAEKWLRRETAQTS